jgi:AcrR family transcriptional regulator
MTDVTTDDQTAPTGRLVSDRRRRDLVLAAYKHIASQGFEGLRTRDVARDAGVNIATLHYYFPTKEALIRGVLLHALQQFAGTLPRDGSARDQLRLHLSAVADLVKSNRELFSVLAELSLRAPRHEAIAETMRGADDVWHAQLVRLLVAGREQGCFDADMDAEGAASLVVSAIKGVSLPTMAGFDAAKVDQVFGQLHRLLGL